MEQVNTREDRIINITSSSDVSSSNSLTREEPSINANRSTLSTSARSSSHARRGNTRARRRSPLNSGLWISIELVLTVSQIVAAIIVLSLSRHEHPRTPLFAWIVGYASGCLAILPLLYWRYRHRNQNSDRDSRQDGNISLPSSVSNGNINLANDTVSRGVNARFKVLVDYFKTALDCFFAIWFVVGNVWIFGGHSSSSDAPNLYRLCIVFLTFSCIGYAMPFILCTTICCCLPCIISVLGFREDPTQSKGATSESIETLPTYKFKVKKNKGSNNGASEGGIVAAGTEKERVISGEDAVCCICLAKYVNNDELKELPCIHYFHKECVDKWLKINATCPLCKSEVGETILSSLTEATASLRQF